MRLVVLLLFLLPFATEQAPMPAETNAGIVLSQDELLKPPYLRRVGTEGDVTIWVVDGAYIRTAIDEEFTNFGHHGSFSFIPENEFWLDREAAPDEEKFFIDHLTVEHSLMRKGMSYDSALLEADSVEMNEREMSGDLRKVVGADGLPDPARTRVRLWKNLESKVGVWIVDGRLVRSVFDIEFTEGGHDYVYEFVPMNEVWIDNDLEENERPYVLLHELHERNLMAKGWTYENAHEDASKVEFTCRHHTDRLHEALAKEGWE